MWHGAERASAQRQANPTTRMRSSERMKSFMSCSQRHTRTCWCLRARLWEQSRTACARGLGMLYCVAWGGGGCDLPLNVAFGTKGAGYIDQSVRMGPLLQHKPPRQLPSVAPPPCLLLSERCAWGLGPNPCGDVVRERHLAGPHRVGGRRHDVSVRARARARQRRETGEKRE